MDFMPPDRPEAQNTVTVQPTTNSRRVCLISGVKVTAPESTGWQTRSLRWPGAIALTAGNGITFGIFRANHVDDFQ